MMSKCKNLRVVSTCSTCRHAKSLYCGGIEGYQRHCLIDDDEPPDPALFFDDSPEQHVAEKVWGDWSEAHRRYDTDVCDEHTAKNTKPLYCLGRSFNQMPRCPVCTYRVECQQASLPRETPKCDVPFADEDDDAQSVGG